jgi:ABC-type Zn2+ transport system substrate-binding protein/surface adhesin
MRYIISLLLTSVAAPAIAEVPRVVTDIPPVHSLVAQVMGDLGQPDLLLEKGANAHSFQLRPSQAAGLQEAGLVVWIGPEMTPWLDRALEGTSTAKELRLLAAEGTFRQDFGAAGAHDHGAEAGHCGHHRTRFFAAPVCQPVGWRRAMSAARPQSAAGRDALRDSGARVETGPQGSRRQDGYDE